MIFREWPYAEWFLSEDVPLPLDEPDSWFVIARQETEIDFASGTTFTHTTIRACLPGHLTPPECGAWMRIPAPVDLRKQLRVLYAKQEESRWKSRGGRSGPLDYPVDRTGHERVRSGLHKVRMQISTKPARHDNESSPVLSYGWSLASVAATQYRALCRSESRAKLTDVRDS